MTPGNRDTSSVPSALFLRTLPPRAPRYQIARAHLELDAPRLVDSPIIVVQAPPGFGKTSLIGQWRRELLARGAAVAWMSADEQDDLPRFVQGLVSAVRSGCARPGFGRFIEQGAGMLGKREGITAWLAEIAQTALDFVLIIDEAERLPPAATDALAYLLHNVPPNLRAILATRGGFSAMVEDLTAYGHCTTVGPDQLKFSFDETIALVRHRLGGAIDIDACARLHELTDGWPLGLQLALSAVQKGGDPRAAIDAITTAPASMGRDHLLGGLMAKLEPDEAGFLTRISLVEALHPELCRALTGRDDAPALLARLSTCTPLFVGSDDSDWCRLHALAREAFLSRLAELPAGEQEQLHRRAMEWFATHGLIREAAHHALRAGHRETAYGLAEQSLYDAVTQGDQEAVLDWVERLPRDELEHRPQLSLAAAWALALSERHDEARRLVDHILVGATKPLQRYECALIASGAAYYADEPDACAQLFAPWSESPPVREPRLLQMHANRLAAIAILRGDPQQARHHLQQVPREAVDKAHGYATRWGAFINGLSYMWEGKIRLCESALRPALSASDTSLGRRHPLSCMMAAVLAAAVYERDGLDEAAGLLANRLDLLERVGTPEATLLGYRTAARIAAAQGIEHSALDLLDTLHAIGMSRHQPRLCVGARNEQIRMHAARSRTETCRALIAELDELLAMHAAARGPVWRQATDWMRWQAHAYAAIAAQDWAAALDTLQRAANGAGGLKLGRAGIEAMALRAYVLHRQGQDGLPLLLEAMNLAQSHGLGRTFTDAHPGLADWARDVAGEHGGDASAAAVPLARTTRSAPVRNGSPRAVPSMVLTPKERCVLELLARSLSNKEIAQAMSVGEETVKWHLKNLFGKLGAGTRKHVVRRAQLLGLLEESE